MGTLPHKPRAAQRRSATLYIGVPSRQAARKQHTVRSTELVTPSLPEYCTGSQVLPQTLCHTVVHGMQP